MLTHPAHIIVFLLCCESLILWAAEHPRTKGFFRFFPAVFWIYFLPMLASTAGLIDPRSPLYGVVLTWVLPASLFLLLLGVDLKAITKLGKTALGMFFCGSAGVMLGTVLTFALFRHVTGSEFASGFGALSASWTGGSANMIAVKEAMGTPEDIFLPMVVVDTVVPYVWMGILVYASNWQKQIDHFNKADHTLIDDIRKRVAGLDARKKRPLCLRSMILILFIAAAASFLVGKIAEALPVVKGVISPFTWTIITVSFMGLIGSLTPLRRVEIMGSTKIGYFLLYFVLMTIGAKASLSHLEASLVLIGAGFVIILVHAVVLLTAARIMKAPLMLAATASQANIGGPASAPIVAEIYQEGLSTVGLLMAVLGNIIGTYLGMITGQICRWMG